MIEWKRFNCSSMINTADIPMVQLDDLRDDITNKVRLEDKRVLAFFGVKSEEATTLCIILGDDTISRLFIASTIFTKDITSYRSFTPEVPSLHLFEREFYEETGIMPVGHPWLKPVRYSKESRPVTGMIEDYPFYSMDGEEVHEVAVGPVHAGVIEPGHFRFMCHGENVYHLEIQLGYQHRGIEKILADKTNSAAGTDIFFPQIAEKIAGDSAVAHASVYAGVMEILTGTVITQKAMIIRTICLELERAAVHIGDLSAIFNDVGFLMGSSTFAALRTLIINTTLLICGSRFGMGLIRPGGVNFDIGSELAAKVLKNVNYVQNKIEKLIPLTMLDQPSVLTRLEGTGTIDSHTARLIGMVGPAARASGVPIDIRTDYPSGMYRQYPARKVVLEKGDVFSRSYIRYIEMMNSFNYVKEQLGIIQGSQGGIQGARASSETTNKLPAEALALSMTEGWRGEIIHIAVTDNKGKLIRYKIKDPSFNNWLGLALAVRNNGVSDFPLCNKSFNLSYCGHDL
jgi:Ni,Fe-hydrogenase III large subunit